jgi:23S rRNA pseudouridine955/2504/2580 synthase
MASIGCPLMGDSKYGHRDVKADGRRHQALYSYKIRFDFTTPAGHLDYLAGKSFQVKQVPFDLCPAQREAR